MQFFIGTPSLAVDYLAYWPGVFEWASLLLTGWVVGMYTQPVHGHLQRLVTLRSVHCAATLLLPFLLLTILPGDGETRKEGGTSCLPSPPAVLGQMHHGMVCTGTSVVVEVAWQRRPSLRLREVSRLQGLAKTSPLAWLPDSVST
jgi:hypothetical protein